MDEEQKEKMKREAAERREQFVAAMKMKEAEKEAKCVQKADLVDGAYYEGQCRNASLARWNGARQIFTHWRTKFGKRFLEDIHCYEDEKNYDVFYPWKKVDDPTDEHDMIPVWDGNRRDDKTHNV